MSNVLEVNDHDKFQSIIDSGETVVVDFAAPAWCAPCRGFAPHFDKASEQLNDVVFVAVDIDKAAWAMEEYGVQSVPTVMLFRDGQYEKNLQERTVLKLVPEIIS